MPFPVEIKYIEETEKTLSVKFPNIYKQKMLNANGGEIVTEEYEFELFPFFDKSDKKRISRTCNHIGLETKNAKEWTGFPENAIAISSDGFGNLLVLKHDGDGMLKDDVLFWNHEDGSLESIAQNINNLI